MKRNFELLIKNLNDQNEADIEQEVVIVEQEEAVIVEQDQYEYVGATVRDQEENDEVPIDVNHNLFHNA